MATIEIQQTAFLHAALFLLVLHAEGKKVLIELGLLPGISL